MDEHDQASGLRKAIDAQSKFAEQGPRPMAEAGQSAQGVDLNSLLYQEGRQNMPLPSLEQRRAQRLAAQDARAALGKAIREDRLEIIRPKPKPPSIFKIAIAAVAFVLALFAISVAVKVCSPPEAEGAEPFAPGIIPVNTSSVQSYHEFFALIGAVPATHENSALHKAKCEEKSGWLWAGSWRGPTGAVLSFCANPLTVSLEDGLAICEWFGGLRFAALFAPVTVLCTRSQAPVKKAQHTEFERAGPNTMLVWILKFADAAGRTMEQIFDDWKAKCEAQGGRFAGLTQNFITETFKGYCIMPGKEA